MNNNENENKTYGVVPYQKVKKALEKIEFDFEYDPISLANLNITFEYLVGSFFPEIVSNINEQMNNQYTNGYFQGRQDALEELESLEEFGEDDED